MNRYTCNQPSLSNELDRVFRAFQPTRLTNPWRWTEKDEAWVGEVDLPGFTKEEVSVNLDKDRVLLIEAKQNEESERAFKRPVATFRLRLPQEADAEKVNAGLENGVLTVTLTKITPDSQRERRIELN
ncbi:MAG: Hsp20/alpha crystallin family protein [Verrucomicrobiota bacterium]